MRPRFSVTRFTVTSALFLSGLFAIGSLSVNADTDLPIEPLQIGHAPQFFVDDYLVDNRWALKKREEFLVRTVHQPVKHRGNPLLPGRGGYVNVVWDEEAKLYRMVYQDFWYYSKDPLKYTYAVAYAESQDGIEWDTPDLGFYQWKNTRQNNICWQVPSDRDGPVSTGAYSQYLLNIPPEHRRGYKFVMYYVGPTGVHLIGSNDCIHWDEKSVTQIGRNFHPDTHASIVWDPAQKKFVWFTRATDRYSDSDNLTRGATRRVARLENTKLWDPWPLQTQNIFIPDAEDAAARTENVDGTNFFYGMPTRYHAGIYWGCLWPYRLKAGLIETHLAISRNGRLFERLPGRPTLIGRGPEGAWDAGMIFASPDWIEVGDQWRIYYGGSDRPHNLERTPGIGLATIRKEGFVSLRGPQHGGVVCTRRIIWPGGSLHVNCDTTLPDVKPGELKVRIVDAARQVIPGFGYSDSIPFTGDSISHEVTWQDQQIDALQGRELRLEFFLTRADLFTFRAVAPGSD
ncbi:MAG: hypothetical protein MK165_16460 [Pirellulaceae bacterium]|nr:hypothetical protein [Pirellulaceae bacterium]